ncbi:MAG: response regulator [Sphingomonadales bacterium]
MSDILVVEDNKADEVFITRAFAKRVPDISITVVRNGADALDYLETHPLPKVILTDLKMPRVDGRQLLKRIKQSAKTRHIPTIVFSTSDDFDDVQSCYAQHANAYMTKPHSPKGYEKVAQSLADYWLAQTVLAQ